MQLDQAGHLCVFRYGIVHGDFHNAVRDALFQDPGNIGTAHAGYLRDMFLGIAVHVIHFGHCNGQLFSLFRVQRAVLL